MQKQEINQEQIDNIENKGIELNGSEAGISALRLINQRDGKKILIPSIFLSILLIISFMTVIETSLLGLNNCNSGFAQLKHLFLHPLIHIANLSPGPNE